MPFPRKHYVESTALDGVAHLPLYSPESGTEPWRSDGTDTGTYPVKDIWAGRDSATPYHLFAAAGKVFFCARDSGSLRFDVWCTDGSDAGTRMLVDGGIAPGRDAFRLAWKNYQLTGPFMTGNESTIYFVADQSGSVGVFRSDGTSAGTEALMLNGEPDRLTLAGDALYFTARSAQHGTELWRSDGTPEGTGLLLDINAGGASSEPQELTAVGTTLYFTADDGVNGRQLWRTDGATTERVVFASPLVFTGQSDLDVPDVVRPLGTDADPGVLG